MQVDSISARGSWLDAVSTNEITQKFRSLVNMLHVVITFLKIPISQEKEPNECLLHCRYTVCTGILDISVTSRAGFTSFDCIWYGIVI